MSVDSPNQETITEAPGLIDGARTPVAPDLAQASASIKIRSEDLHLYYGKFHALLTDDILWQRMSRAALEWAAHFNWDHMADETLEWIEEAISRGRNR